MKILLTGASGFLGSYFINKYSLKYKIETFSFLNDNFKNLDLNDVDTVIHFSALVHQIDGATKKEYEKVNVNQTMMLAKKSKENGIKHFLFMSSIAVYGIETGIINGKSDCNPITDYGKSKFKAELELQKLEDDNFKIAIIRPPIVNGFEAPGNMKSLINLVKKITILPFGGLENRRSMLHVGNLCHIMDTIIQKEIGGVFLVSDEKPLSSTRLLELIAQNLNKKIYLIKIPFFESFIKFIRPSIYKRLYESLEIDNSQTMKILFGNVKSSLPFSAEDGIRFMIRGEEIYSQSN